MNEEDLSTYLEAYRKWLKNTGVKVGDKVLVISNGYDWRVAHFGTSSFPDEMVGHVYRVTDINGTANYGEAYPLAVDGWVLPFYAVIPVEETENEPTNTD